MKASGSITIWVIGLAGPEWFDVREARYTEKKAKDRCTELNSSLLQKKNKSTQERLSIWDYKPANLKGN